MYTDINLHDCRKIFVKNYLCIVRIGVHPHEKLHPQKIRLNVIVYLPKQHASPKKDSLIEVYDYDSLIQILNTELMTHQVQLQETLCSNIAKAILRDHRVRAVHISSEKLAVSRECESIGIEILEYQS